MPGVIFAAQPTGRYALAIEKMKELNKQHPDISQLINLGKNDEGVDIIGMRVSTTPRVIDNRKIGQLVVATHHGNEGKSTTLALYFLARLLRRFESGQLYTHNLGAMEWTIIPVLNVSGFNANSRHEHGVDPVGLAQQSGRTSINASLSSSRAVSSSVRWASPRRIFRI